MDDRPLTSSKIAQLDQVYREYKNRLEEAERESNDIVNSAWKKAEALIADAQKKARQTADEIELSAKKEAEKILGEAKNTAERLTKETEHNLKKTAGEKTRGEVERIMAATREEARREAARITEEAKQETERILGSIKDEARAEAEKEMAQIVNEAKSLARKVDEESIARAAETNKLLIEVMQKAENCFSKIRAQMETELNDYTLTIGKAKDTLQNHTLLEELRKSSTASEEKERQSGGEWKELRIISPYDERQVKRLMEFLRQIPSIKLAGEEVSENGFSIYINIIKPMPLLKLLNGISMVADSDARGDMIKLRLKADVTI
ncbi:MAG: hypothetical protein PHR43_02360 [Dehalococcoidales bacterium]|nr:hypothetical protein [Dehalococcoidales bacterium]